MIARATVRRIYNDPRLTVHVERCVLHWLMYWDPASRQGVRQHIALRAANEARRWMTSSNAERTEILGRSNELIRLAPPRDHVRT